MKMLKKLALVSAVSMISAGVFAMEAMDEETMSVTTGQDGITILVIPGEKDAADLTALGVSSTLQTGIDANADTVWKGLSIRQVVIHDDDGWTNGATPFGGTYGGTAGTTDNSGAIVIGDGTAPDSTVVIADNAVPIRIDIDAVGDHNNDGTDSAMLNVRIATPTLGIKVGSISVANSNAADGVDIDTDTDGDAYTGAVGIMNGMEITLGATVINIQLGNESQGGMIAVNAVLTGGLNIADLALNDVNSGGSITASSLKVVDSNVAVAAVAGVDANADGDFLDVGDTAPVAAVAGFSNGDNLTAGVTVDVVDSIGGADTIGGMRVTLNSLGTANGINVTLNDQNLGAVSTTRNLGDIQIKGLDLAGTQLIIRGH